MNIIMEVLMKKLFWIANLLVITVIAVTACGTSNIAKEQPLVVEQLPEEVSENINDGTALTESKSEQPVQSESSFPAWYSTPLIDVNTGEVFTIEENLGKVILVETLATWCSNCYKQQSEVARFHDLLGERDDFISLGIDIDPNEDLLLLEGYIHKNGFDWFYIVANEKMINEISSLYGPQFLNPPSTTMLIIDRNGNVHPLNFGIKSAEELINNVLPFFNESS
jgi:thiol-disulfide isomerase/thioredoxin